MDLSHLPNEQRQQLIMALQYQNEIFAKAVAAVEVIEEEERAIKKRKRKHWVRPWIERRINFGIYDKLMVELRNEDTAAFYNFMRMPPVMFDELLHKVGPRITKQHTFYRPPLEPGLKLAITLRHLASGNSYASMKFAWRVPHNTISKVVREVCQAIIDEYLDEAMVCPNTPDGWREVANRFYQKWNFPHTCGALDGKHVGCRCPPKSGSQYFNYKGFYSVVLLALVDADYKFLWADIGGMGSASDAQIFNDSELKECCDDATIGFPRPEPLPGDNVNVPYFFVGDDAFSLRTSMMKPYSRRGLDRDERIFNYRLSRARMVVENAFGILVQRFQVLLNTMCHLPSTVKVIVTTCIILHNLMRVRFPDVINRQADRAENAERDFVPGAWRKGQNLDDTIHVSGPNVATKEAKRQRNLLRHWVNSEVGAVPWQEKMI